MQKRAPNKIEINSKGGRAREEKFILRLFVTGILPNSAQAIININSICEQYLKGKYELEIIDIYQQPSLALKEDIIAIPLLIKKYPLPQERIIGDMSNTEIILRMLRIKHKSK
jgi:circadian clock protein KaiB